jgi:hypothetical protein
MPITAKTLRVAPDRAIAKIAMTTSAARMMAKSHKGKINDPVDGSKLNISPSSLGQAPAGLFMLAPTTQKAHHPPRECQPGFPQYAEPCPAVPIACGLAADGRAPP